MSLLKIPFGIRCRIYNELLRPPHGDVSLDWDFQRGERIRETSGPERDSEWNPELWVNPDFAGNGDTKEDVDETISSLWDECGASSDLASTVPLHTSIMSVNRMIYAEARPVLYSNRFTFKTSPENIIGFFKGLSNPARLEIKHIKFGTGSTAADDYSVRDYWKPLLSFITCYTRVSSVTIRVPDDMNHSIDTKKERGRKLNGEWYWFPACKGLRDLLLEGKIQRLRLTYDATYLPAPERECNAGTRDEELFSAVDDLRHPRSKAEVTRERKEIADFMQARDEGRSHRFDSWAALERHQEVQRERLDFVVTREDDCPGDIGTVLVLTRPSPTESGDA